MVQGTTPTYTCKLPDTVDLTLTQNIYFTIKQGDNKITKTGDALSFDKHSVSVYFTQKETLSFREGTAFIKLNWTYSDGSRGCSKTKAIRIDENLLQEVLQ